MTSHRLHCGCKCLVVCTGHSVTEAAKVGCLTFSCYTFRLQQQHTHLVSGGYVFQLGQAYKSAAGISKAQVCAVLYR
jgi:hypothetical protein